MASTAPECSLCRLKELLSQCRDQFLGRVGGHILRSKHRVPLVTGMRIYSEPLLRHEDPAPHHGTCIRRSGRNPNRAFGRADLARSTPELSSGRCHPRKLRGTRDMFVPRCLLRLRGSGPARQLGGFGHPDCLIEVVIHVAMMTGRSGSAMRSWRTCLRRQHPCVRATTNTSRGQGRLGGAIRPASSTVTGAPVAPRSSEEILPSISQDHSRGRRPGPRLRRHSRWVAL